MRSHAIRSSITFDFRELVTLRERQAKARALNTAKKSSTGQRSSITSASGWLRAKEHHFSGATDTFGQSETPAIRQRDVEQGRGDSPANRSTASGASKVVRGPAPSGWRIQVLGQKNRQPLTKSRTSIGSDPSADVIIEGATVDRIQCWLEFDGQYWQLRQQSMSYPTYLNGRVASFGPVRHGDRLTFEGKIGFRLIDINQSDANSQKLQTAVLLLLVLSAVGAGVAWWLSQ